VTVRPAARPSRVAVVRQVGSVTAARAAVRPRTRRGRRGAVVGVAVAALAAGVAGAGWLVATNDAVWSAVKATAALTVGAVVLLLVAGWLLRGRCPGIHCGGCDQ
jgi:hypothetical protein